MNALSDQKYIRQLLGRHGFTFSKALGQNFLINPSVCPRMAEAAVIEGGGVLEIGPGIGVLTKELSKRAKKVVAVELDRRLLPVLSETLDGCDNVLVVEGDAMKLDLLALIQSEFAGMPVTVAANLPYYITSPLLMRLLEERLPVESITVMVQKEAAVRLCAKEGSRESGAVTLAVRYYSEPSVLFSVSRESFVPAPNVDSAVIQLLVQPPVVDPALDERHLFSVIRGGFSQRRKTLLNALSSALGIGKETLRVAFSKAEIDPGERAERLSLDDFRALSKEIQALEKPL